MAVSCATNVSELLPLALKTVAVAFRVGACAWDLGDGIASSQPESYPPWTASLYGISVEDVRTKIRDFAVNRVRVRVRLAFRWKRRKLTDVIADRLARQAPIFPPISRPSNAPSLLRLRCSTSSLRSNRLAAMSLRVYRSRRHTTQRICTHRRTSAPH